MRETWKQNKFALLGSITRARCDSRRKIHLNISPKLLKSENSFISARQRNKQSNNNIICIFFTLALRCSGPTLSGAGRMACRQTIDSCAANSRGPLDQWDTLQVISGNEKSIGVIDTRRLKSNFGLIKRACQGRRPAGSARYRKSTTTCHINICAINIRVQLKTFSPATAGRGTEPKWAEGDKMY